MLKIYRHVPWIFDFQVSLENKWEKQILNYLQYFIWDFSLISLYFWLTKKGKQVVKLVVVILIIIIFFFDIIW